MPIVKCLRCHKSFYAKPSWIKYGNGKYCSRACHYADKRKGKFVYCEICGKKLWRKPHHVRHCKSKKFFCTKSHQTLWRNKIFSGTNHPNWKNGENIAYRKILIDSKIKSICKLCRNKDERLLVAHHVDKNRKNNKIKNLIWLCRNCHFLIHNYPVNLK